MKSEKLYIGIDGGGTKTNMVIGDQGGRLVDFIAEKSTSHQTTPEAFANFSRLLSSLKNRTISQAVIYQAGWDYAHDQEIVLKNINNALKENNITVENMLVENDVMALVKAGMKENSSGVGVVSGTGSIAIAIDGGTTIRSWGMGPAYGDWGSGKDMVDHAFMLLAASAYGREEAFPVLEKLFLEHFEEKDLRSLVLSFINGDRSLDEIAGKMPLVIEGFKRDCRACVRVLNKGGRELARTVAGLKKQVVDKDAPVILGGGVFQRFGLLPGFRDTLEKLLETIPEIRLVKSPPVYGSMLHAFQLGKVETTEVLEKIDIQIL